MGSFTNEVQSLCLLRGVIYNFSSDQFDNEHSIETMDLEQLVPDEGNGGALRPRVAKPWSKRGGGFDFNPNEVAGAFPLVVYPELWPDTPVGAAAAGAAGGASAS